MKLKPPFIPISFALFIITIILSTNTFYAHRRISRLEQKIEQIEKAQPSAIKWTSSLSVFTSEKEARKQDFENAIRYLKGLPDDELINSIPAK